MPFLSLFYHFHFDIRSLVIFSKTPAQLSPLSKAMEEATMDPAIQFILLLVHICIHGGTLYLT